MGTVAKVVEITSASEKSFEDAIAVGVKKASESIQGITGAWVQDMKVVVNDGNVTEYRVNLKLTFILK